MQKRKWISVKGKPGVRFYKHPERKHGVGFDRFYEIRFKVGKKSFHSYLGWASEGVTAKSAEAKRALYKRNAMAGEEPRTIVEERKLAEGKKEAEAGKKAEEEKRALTFGSYFKDKYLPAQQSSKKKASTCKWESLNFKNWLEPTIGGIRLINLKQDHIEKVREKAVEAGKSSRTIQAILGLGRQVWNHARNNRDVEGDYPGRNVKVGRFDNRRQRFLTADECDRLIAKLRGVSSQVADMAVLSLDTGLRAGEIFSLRHEDLNLFTGQIKVMDSKGGVNRTAYMTRRAKDILKAFDGKNGLVFPSMTGGRIKQISKTVERAIADIGLNNDITDPRNKATFHSLRHTYASNLVECGVSLYVVKDLLGHSTLAMTERYSHVNDKSKKAAVEQLEQARKSNTRGKGKVVKLRQ